MSPPWGSTCAAPLTSAGSPIEIGSRAGTRPEDPRLVEQPRPWRVEPLREQNRELGQPDTHEHAVPVLDLAGGGERHDLGERRPGRTDFAHR